MRNAIVTGATGMLALALIKLLVEHDFIIYAVVHKNSVRITNIPTDKNIKIIKCDLDEMDKLPDMIGEKCDMFFHFAWNGTFSETRNDMSLQTDNIKDTVKAAYSAIKLNCKVFLGAGSQAEYGRKSSLISPDTSTFPENGYGMAKLCAGQMTREICRQNGVKHIWCRIFSIYGPYDNTGTMIMSGITSLLEGKRPSYTKGEQQWDYLYCDDAAEAFYAAAERGKDGSVYCVGSGKVRSLKEYIIAVRDAVDKSADIGIGEIPYSEKQVMYLCADISDLTSDTGFVPITSFEDGIKKTVDWLIKERIRRK